MGVGRRQFRVLGHLVDANIHLLHGMHGGFSRGVLLIGAPRHPLRFLDEGLGPVGHLLRVVADLADDALEAFHQIVEGLGRSDGGRTAGQR